MVKNPKVILCINSIQTTFIRKR